MDPFSVGAAVTVVLNLVDWKRVQERLVADAMSKGTKSLVGRFAPSDQEKAARQAIGLFAGEFLQELDDKVALSAAIPGYPDQVNH